MKFPVLMHVRISCAVRSRCSVSHTKEIFQFANNFWGKDDAGVEPLLTRMNDAKQTCDELKAFYNGTVCLPNQAFLCG